MHWGGQNLLQAMYQACFVLCHGIESPCHFKAVYLSMKSDNVQYWKRKAELTLDKEHDKESDGNFKKDTHFGVLYFPG